MDSWWADAERWVIREQGLPPGEAWQQASARVLLLDQAMAAGARIREAVAQAQAAGAPSGPLAVLQLLSDLRNREPGVALAAEAEGRSGAPQDAARAWHLAALAHSYAGAGESALVACLEGLEVVEESPRRYWLLGTLANLLVAQGAWTEARHTYRVVARHRQESGDTIGQAITAGRRARLELGLGEPRAALEHIDAALDAVGSRLPNGSRLRLATLGLEAALELGEPDAERVRAVREGIGQPDAGYFAGLGALALLRTRASADERARWLELARARLTDPSGREQVEAWAEHLADDPVPAVPMRIESIGLGAFREAMLRSVRANRRGHRALGLAWLDRADALATRASIPLWIEEVSRRYAVLDPVRGAMRVAQRFSGLPEEALRRTVQEDVTIVFNDLVGFTDRSRHLDPVQVMETVRSLFEVSTPLLARHRVRPLQYLGDGLLAVAQGPAHQARGLAFATELVARCGTMGRVRRARGEQLPLTTRAGVASGTVVLGLVGTLAKQEHLAIGRTTNLAARLQSRAAPGEVVAFASEGHETVVLKGFDEPVRIRRVLSDSTAG